METLNRREFAGLMPALLTIAGALAGTAEGQATGGSTAATGTAAPRPVKELASGVFKPTAGKAWWAGMSRTRF